MERHTGLVSVLLACGDRPYLLRKRAIPSLLAQTHDNWELIVVSDREGNSRLADAAISFGDRRIRYEELPRSPNAGAPSRVRALNHAQGLARGDVLCVLDEGDEFLPSHLHDSLEALDANSADLVCGVVRLRDYNTGSEILLDDNVFHPSTVCYTATWRTVEFSESDEDSTGYLKWSKMIDAGAKLVHLRSPQAVSYGNPATSRVRVSMPSLPSTKQLHDLVDSVAASRQLSNRGPIAVELEAQLANYLGAQRVMTAPSGDTALAMAMLFVAERRGDRDEVVLPSYTFPSTVNAVLRAGLKPVFCDVEPETLCASAETMAPLVNERTVALLPVDAHGVPCDMTSLEGLARDAGSLLISDSAAALGAQIGDRMVGTYGDMAVFSLSSTKVLTSGEGGFISLNDDHAEPLMRAIGRYGLDDNFACMTQGVNGRLAELSAGIALAGLDYLHSWLAARRKTAARYEERLRELRRLRIVPHRVGDRIGSAKDVVVVADCTGLRDHLAGRLSWYGIETRPYFRPLHRMAPFKDFVRSDLEVTDHLADKMLCLPITNELPEATLEYVIDVLNHELEDCATG